MVFGVSEQEIPYRQTFTRERYERDIPVAITFAEGED
jgi:hypothetical protein